jgi:hypothetical protein
MTTELNLDDEKFIKTKCKYYKQCKWYEENSCNIHFNYCGVYRDFERKQKLLWKKPKITRTLDKKQTKPKQKSIKNININVIKKTLNENEIKKIIDNNFEELREKLYMIAEQGIINEKKMMYKKYGVKMKNG